MAKRKLRSQVDRPEVGEEVERSFDEPPHEASAVFEHGHWWVTCPCGAQWDAVDTSDGFGFERVSEGDEDYHRDDEDEYGRNGRRPNNQTSKSCGFAIDTYTQSLIEENAADTVRRDGNEGVERFVTKSGEITKAGWDQLNKDIARLEQNVLWWLKRTFVSAVDHGHGVHDDLIGNLHYDRDDKKQRDLVDEGLHETIPFDELPGGSTKIWEGVSEFGQGVVNGTVSFFDPDPNPEDED